MESFNARYLSYKEVADSFVITENFRRLVHPCHTIVMGPRGCGKTTMLKMLHPFAAQLIQDSVNIPFWGIYIPTDKQWSMQLDLLEQIYPENEALRLKVSRALVNLNALYALCETFEALMELAGIEEGEYTFGFYKELKTAWKIEKPIAPTMGAIKITLKMYVSEVNALFNMNSGVINLPYAGAANMIDLLILGIEIFENSFANNEYINAKKKWALCIDEMELAPTWLMNYIKSCMRSVDSRLLFKITSIPTPSESGNFLLNSTESNDYEVIRSWIYNETSKSEWIDFCRSYIDKYVLAPEEINYEQFLEMLTPPDFDYKYQKKKDLLNKLVKNLLHMDKSFYNYLLRNGVDVTADNVLDTCKKSVVTFTYRVLYERYQLMCNEGNEHAASVYYAYMDEWLLYEYSDGSPRVFINLMKEIRRLMYQSKTLGVKKVRLNEIADLIIDTSERTLYNKFAYYPALPLMHGNKFYAYKEILDAIGDYFSNLLKAEDYVMLPETLFSYESNDLNDFITQALDAGAIMVIDDKTLYQGIKKGHVVFRLNYGLYPYYHYIKTTSRNVVAIDDILN